MMKKIFFTSIFGLSIAICFAQAPDAETMHKTAKTFMQQGDYPNAIVVLNRALLKEPMDLEMLKDLAFAYYLQRDYVKALNTAKPLIDRTDADVQCYQELGLVYKAIEERKECEKMYKAGIKRFPKSGVLYNEYGEMLWTKQDYSAIKLWEKGIEADPNYSSNYYNACKYYYFTYDKTWSLLYGEIFVNLESYSKRTTEVKEILLNSYKKLFSDADVKKNQAVKNPFTSAYLEEMNKQSGLITQGITAETLTSLRSHFILDWFESQATKFPYRLFEYQQQLIKNGMFDAYNQWLFGASQNLADFQTWTTAHADEYKQFTDFQGGRVFKLPAGQYYQTVAAK